MKGKKNKKEKIARTSSEVLCETNNHLKFEEQTYQILGNRGGEYIKTKLPKDFYENITFGEMSLEYDFSIEKLTNLTDLYSLGIQYFLENNPAQAKLFQDRMGFILTNKDILSNLKKQQEEEEKEKQKQKEEKNKAEEKKNHHHEKKDKKYKFAKSEKNLPKENLRKRARTNFMMKTQNIKDEEIKRKVTFVLNKDVNKIKEDKENVKNIINEDINKQNLQWKEKLKMKKNNLNTSFGAGIRPRNRTFILKMKKFQTPGVDSNRGIMTLKSPNNPNSPIQIMNNFKNDLAKRIIARRIIILI